MKKIAILLTGQLRTCEMVKYLHMNSLISKYNSDVFLSIDLDNTLQCENKNSKNKTSLQKVKNIVDYFNPIDYFVLENFDNEFHKLQSNTKIDLTPHKILFQQYHVVNNAYQMLIRYMEKTNTTYDMIIRLRFDQFIWTDETHIFENLIMIDNKIIYNDENTYLIDKHSKNNKIIFDEIDNNNNIYLFGFGDFLHYKYANDQFWYHNSRIIDVISNFYNNMLEILQYCNDNNIGSDGALIEFMYYTYLTNNNINMKQSRVKGIFIREF